MTIALVRPRSQRLLLDDVSWQAYERMLRALQDRRLRITYDEGSLEIMTPSLHHERTRHLLGLLITISAVELGLNISGGGSLTMRRRLKKRGLEPDECYWIKNAAAMRNKKDFDLRRDPPPDLALEVDISRSVLNRMKIYAALGIPEVWRSRQDKLTVYLLNEEGSYEEVRLSDAFARFDPQQMVSFVELGLSEGDTKMIRAFQTWIKKHAPRS